MTSSSPSSARQNQTDAGTEAAAGATGELVILGNGFFIVRDPETDESYATQAGHFDLDDNGYLVTDTGARVQGYNDSALSTLGDIQINAADLPSTSAPGSTLLCYVIDEWGKIAVHLSDGTSFLRGQIMLQNFQDPQALVSEGNRLYSNISVAGPLPALAAPGSNGLGIIQSCIPDFSNTHPTSWPN